LLKSEQSKQKIKIQFFMKRIVFYSVWIIPIAFLVGAFSFSCSKNDDPTQQANNFSPSGKTNSKSNPNARIATTTCSISGPTTVTAGSTQTYTYSNTTGTPETISWSVENSPAGSMTISGSGATVTVTFASNFASGTLVATGAGGTASTCEDKLNIAISGVPPPPICSASINSIWCSQGSGGYNAMINANVNVKNPFPHTASVSAQWDPNYFSGVLAAGGQYNLAVGASIVLPSQFEINAQTSSSSGFYVPMLVTYTDLVTQAVCTVSLDPLVTGGCNGAPM
jgi:hypothetical protein